MSTVTRSRPIVLAYLALVVGLLLAWLPANPALASTPGTWSATGSMSTARTDQATVLLSSGKVLVSGGRGSTGVLASAEVYDPASGAWSSAGNMNYYRYSHTATLLVTG